MSRQYVTYKLELFSLFAQKVSNCKYPPRGGGGSSSIFAYRWAILSFQTSLFNKVRHSVPSDHRAVSRGRAGTVSDTVAYNQISQIGVGVRTKFGPLWSNDTEWPYCIFLLGTLSSSIVWHNSCVILHRIEGPTPLTNDLQKTSDIADFMIRPILGLYPPD